MRLPGYARRAPDPIRPGVMAPGRAPEAVLTLPRPRRRHLFCLLGHHKRDYIRLHAAGETWSTFIYHCRRCNVLLDGAHAVKADKPVT